jgi:hypothetical protein
MIRAIGLVIAIVAPCCPFGAQGDLAALYRKALPELRASAVPVLLLRKLPSEYNSMKSTAVGWADKTGYDVGFSEVSDCGGAPPCSRLHVGAFLANARLGREYKQHARRIRLPDGTIGYFRPRDCSGASCTEAALSFQRGPYVYEIDEKFGMYIVALGHKQDTTVDIPILKKLYSDLRSQ